MLEELKARRQWVAYSHAKIPIGPDGSAASVTDPETWTTVQQAAYTARVRGLPGVGYVLTAEDPYVVVDLDGAVEPGVGVKPWAQEIVDLLDSYTEVSPSGMGLHVWCTGAIPRPGARIKRDDGSLIELYQSARYMTVTGRVVQGLDTIHDRYQQLAALWAQVMPDPAPQSLPGVNARPAPEWESPPVDEWLGDALRTIPADDYHDWLRVGLALKGELGDSGWVYFQQWSASSTKYDGDAACLRKWRGLKPDGSVNIATVVWMAERHGFRMPAARIVLPPGYVGGWVEWVAEHEQTPSDEPESRLKVRWIDAADAYQDATPPEPDLVSPGVLAPGDMMVVFGPPKSMKSMVLLDMAVQWAQGKPWLDLIPSRPLTIAVCQFEVREDRMRQRVQQKALSSEAVQALRGRLLWTDRFTAAMGVEFVSEFAASLEAAACVPDVLVIDPLANLFSGDDENSNAQMSRFLRECYVLRAVVNPAAALVLVHHARKGAGEADSSPFDRLRGAGSLRGAYDTGVYLDWAGPDVLQAHWELRNGPSIEPLSLRYVDGVFERVTSAGVAVVLIEWIIEEARQGRLYSKAQATKHAPELVGMDAPSLGSLLRSLVDSGELVSFKPADVIGGEDVPEPHAKSHGWLGVPGMETHGGTLKG